MKAERLLCESGMADYRDEQQLLFVSPSYEVNYLNQYTAITSSGGTPSSPHSHRHRYSAAADTPPLPPPPLRHLR